jgi:hypothetical protein
MIEREGNLYKIDFIDCLSSSTIVRKYLIGQEVTLSLWRECEHKSMLDT